MGRLWPDDVLELVSPLQLALELRVLVQEALALGLHEAVDAQGLPEERGDDVQERRLVREVAPRLVGEREGEDADGLPVDRDGHGDEAQLALRRGGGAERLFRGPQERLFARPAGRRRAGRWPRRGP